MSGTGIEPSRLEEQVNRQAGQINQLEKENGQLKAINKKLREEVNLLKERLGLNSTNSSLPPSRDLYKQKRQERKKSGRKAGGQPGHAYHSYQPLAADEIIEVVQDKCSCGHQIEKEDRYRIEQKIEIPLIKPYVKEYRRFYGKCCYCKKQKLAPLPVGVSKDLLGDHVKALIAAFNGYQHNSKREVQTILKDVFNLPLSLGLISNTSKGVNKKLEASYKQLQEQVLESSYLHIDETGHCHKGQRAWGWIVTNKQTSVLKLHPSRGKKVLQELVGAYNGYVISDRYGGYNYFKANKRQICWSHLQRDFERFAHSLDTALAVKGKRLVYIASKVFTTVKAMTQNLISTSVFISRIEKYKKGVYDTLKSILALPGVEQAHRVARNLINSFDMMWRFVDQKDVEMTNNLAERQLRKFVIYRKKLLFTWSNWGMLFVERMLSLFLSSKLRGDNPFQLLLTAINPEA